MEREHTQVKGLLSRDNAKAVWRYATRPEILPRIRGLGIHFGHFAYLIALVLHSARLLPSGSPMIRSEHIGKFGVRQVLASAANNITWSWKSIDQIAIFGAVVAGIIMIAIQAVLIAAYALLGEAQASSPASFFSTPDANVPTDVVLIFLEQVFGANLSVFGAASQPLGTPVYTGLHALLSFYSLATMTIAVVIVLYYIVTVIGEAAKTGTPFGQRFNSLWAPIRLVIALGLLVPLGSGLNTAQYLTLYAAKMGSGLATTAWTIFVDELTSATSIVSKPDGESTSALVERIFLNEVCAASYNQINGADSINILQVTGRRESVTPNFASPSAMITAAEDAGQDSVILSWSRADAGESATDYACGKISVSLTEFDVYSNGTNVVAADEKWWWSIPWAGQDMEDKLGKAHQDVKISYLKEIKRISEKLYPAGEALAAYNISINPASGFGDASTLDFIPDLLSETAQESQDNINVSIEATYTDIAQSSYVDSSSYDEMKTRGWGAAGLWYGTMGTINKKYMDALASAVPTLDVLFEAAEVRENERGVLGRLFGVSRYDMRRGATREIEQTISYASDEFAGYVVEIDVGTSPLYGNAQFEQADEAGSSSWLAKGLIAMLGGRQLYLMKNEPDLDPMARLAAAGHAMVKRSLIFAGLGTAFGLGGAVAGVVPDPRVQFVGEAAGAVSAFLFVFAGIALTAGIFLAYILPIIPFVYFAFAVMGWILEIFEAIVAMPLWALAHLRIEGDGMPGAAALGGYQLLLMILLRPALIVLGLIGGYVIFGAAAYYFGTLFNAATAITQSDIASTSIGAIGIFVYTIIYTFLIYNIALMCFKMVDDVPKGILRWMGAGVSPFSDSRGDPINGSREMVAGGAAAAIGLSRGTQGAAKNMQTAMKRRKMRSQGADPDDPVQKVQVVGDTPSSPRDT